MSSMMSRLPGVVFPSDRGERNAATLLQVLVELGSAPATIMLDAGEWIINEDVTIPASVSLVLLRGAKFLIGIGRTLTLDGCELQAGPSEIFVFQEGGGNLVTYASEESPPSFPYLHPQWVAAGDADKVVIGNGYMLAVLEEAAESNVNISLHGFTASAHDTKTGMIDTLAISPLGLRQALDDSMLLASQIPSHDNLRGVAADQHRRIHVSAGVPTGGQDGDIWVQYS